MNTRTRKIKSIHAFEQLSEIDDATGDEQVALLKLYGAKLPLNMLLSLNFDNTIKLSLPEGMPELDLKHMDANTHPDMAGLLSSSIHKLKYCLDSNKVMKSFQKEKVFYETLINIPLKDAEILCSAKDHALEELYPNITAELVASVFPQYVKE